MTEKTPHGDVCIVSGSFDNMHSREMRFLEEAARIGRVTVLLWSDEHVQAVTGKPAKFPSAERKYFLEAVRFVEKVILVYEAGFAHGTGNPDALPDGVGGASGIWAVMETDDTPAKRAWCAAHGIRFHRIQSDQLDRFPPPPEMDLQGTPGRKKVLVTGCYDWLHSGHVRFFEEASEYGDLYVVVGNDANVRHLKGEGHPLFPEDLRRYMTGSIRYVHQALITSGWGWMDAEPEIVRLKPDIYLVNEDGDRPEKRVFSAEHGLEYVVLKRLPKEGLQRRSSTDLRGF
jgi:cytidyltransferase-like protein